MKNKLGTTTFNYICCSILIVFMMSLFAIPLLHVKGSVADVISSLPAPNQLLKISRKASGERLCGLRFSKKNPQSFEFIFENPKSNKSNKADRKRLIKYFVTALTTSSDKLWVNLSPYEKNRIIEDDLAQTELGVNMLAQDYLLKQLSSSLTHPKSKIGKQYWSNTENINQFNKVWISADKAELYVGDNTMILGKANLKVETEEDYLAKKRNGQSSSVGQNIVMKDILDVLETEVNHGQHFVELRQIYNSVVLANSFKTILRKHFLSKSYSNKNKLLANQTEDSSLKDQIYNRYLLAFQKGVYDLIETEKGDRPKRKVRYFSGGASLRETEVNSSSINEFSANADSDYYLVEVVPHAKSEAEIHDEFYSQRVVASQNTSEKSKNEFYAEPVVDKKDEISFDYTSWDGNVKHQFNELQGNEFFKNTVVENSKLVKPNKTLLLADYSGSLQADLARCIAVLAHNNKTGENALAHIFPPQARSLINNRWYKEAANIKDIESQEKTKILDQRLSMFKGKGWRFVVVNSIDSSNMKDSKDINMKDVIAYLNDMGVEENRIEIDNEEVFKTVLIDQKGQVSIYKENDKDFSIKLDSGNSDRIIMLASSSSALTRVKSILSKSLMLGFVTYSALFADMKNYISNPDIETVVDNVEYMLEKKNDIEANNYLQTVLNKDKLNPSLLMLKAHLESSRRRKIILFALATEIGVPMVFEGNDPFKVLPEHFSTVPKLLLEDVIVKQNTSSVSEMLLELKQVGVFVDELVDLSDVQKQDVEPVEDNKKQANQLSNKQVADTVIDNLDLDSMFSEARDLFYQNDFEKADSLLSKLTEKSQALDTLVLANDMRAEIAILTHKYKEAAKFKMETANIIYKKSEDLTYALDYAEYALKIYPSHSLSASLIELYLKGNLIKQAQYEAFMVSEYGYSGSPMTFTALPPRAHDSLFTSTIYDKIDKNKSLRQYLLQASYDRLRNSHVFKVVNNGYYLISALNLAEKIGDSQKVDFEYQRIIKYFENLGLSSLKADVSTYGKIIERRIASLLDDQKYKEAVSVSDKAIARVKNMNLEGQFKRNRYAYLLHDRFDIAVEMNDFDKAMEIGFVYIEYFLSVSEEMIHWRAKEMYKKMNDFSGGLAYNILLLNEVIADEYKKQLIESLEEQEEDDSSSAIEGYGGIDFSLDGLKIEQMRAEFDLPAISSSAMQAFEFSQGLSFKIISIHKVENIKQELLSY